MTMNIKKTVFWIYFINLLMGIAVVIYLALSSGIKSKMLQATENSLLIDEGWTTSDGVFIDDVSRLDCLESSSPWKENSIFHDIPTSLEENTSICFRAKHIYFSVYADGNLLYSQMLPKNRLYTNSDGAVWALVPINSDYAGSQVEIRYQLCYEKSSAGIDNVFLGSERGFILTIIEEKFGAVFLSLFFILLSILFLISSIPIHISKANDHELLYLGLISFVIGVFCFVETQVLQLFIGNERILHLLSCLSLLMIPIPVVLYADEAFGLKYKMTSAIFCIISFLLSFLLFILNYLDIRDYHDTLPIIHAMDIAAILIILYAMIRYYIIHYQQVMKSVYSLMRIAGLLVLAITGSIDVSRFYAAKTQDPAAFIRFGVLCFILCFSAASLQKSIQGAGNDAKAELIRTLAYHDGLTGIGNRTAYQERLNEIKNSGEKIGLVMMDVNNLKLVNDEKGHDIGDQLLKKCAEFIQMAFNGIDSDCYRIGGDEFVVILHGAETSLDFRSAKTKLMALCNAYNAQPSTEFKVSIASGYASLNKKLRTIEDVCKTADANMYENKRIMKQEAANAGHAVAEPTEDEEDED